MNTSKIIFAVSKTEERLVLFFFIVVFCYQFILNAWVAEDGFINFRVITHYLDGDGLVWNKGERVQVFTSPLWMLLTIVGATLTGELYNTTVFLSFVCTVLTFITLFYCANKNTALFILSATLLLLSKSFVDYSSSGLEPPLVALTLGIFTHLYCHLESKAKKTLIITCSAGICAITRHDTVLLTAPFVMAQVIQSIQPFSVKSLYKQCIYLAFGLSPLLIWSLFSLIYFGLLFPNTANAKIIPNSDQFNAMDQAINFFKYTQHFDPVTLCILAITISVSLVYKSRYTIPLIASMSCFMIYLLHIGADYMAGRFFIGPIIMSIMIFTSIIRTETDSLELLRVSRKASLTVFFIPSLIIGISHLAAANNSTYGKYFRVDGINDERGHYFNSTDFLTVAFSGLNHQFKKTGIKINKDLNTKEQVVISCHIGMIGYFAGSEAYIIDPLAISDPFLGRLPLRAGIHRIGHFERYVPRDYLLSILSRSNRFSNPLAYQYYEDVLQATQKPLFSSSRFRALWRLNTGYYIPKLRELSISDLGGPVLAEGESEFEVNSCIGGKRLPVYIVGEQEVRSKKIQPLITEY